MKQNNTRYFIGIALIKFSILSNLLFLYDMRRSTHTRSIEEKKKQKKKRIGKNGEGFKLNVIISIGTQKKYKNKIK